MNKKKAILIILDGWGIGSTPESDAIQQANTPFIDELYHTYPNSELVTYGEAVGLPEGQMGNSEVGHMNIGAGRVVYQSLARINKDIREQIFHKNEVLLEALAYAKKEHKAVHLMGLLSDGGVHSHINHLKTLCDITEAQALDKVYVHAFMDGRDTDPKGGADYLKELMIHIANQNVELASVIGRYYAMDRDQRWERIKLAYDLLVHGKGEPTMDAVATILQRYETAEETDEFLKPIVCTDMGKAVATIQEGDVVISFNFRTDRPRQITEVLTQKEHADFNMQPLDLHYVTMTAYDEKFKGIHLLYKKEDIHHTLGEIVARNNKTQVRIAETEKYAHVTFFFSGGREAAFKGERRLLIPSPKVATYDLQPEMSANEITASIIKDIKENQPDFICLNYANTDMIGHTGNFEAASKAAETVDTCLAELIKTTLAHDYTAIVIADHGNSDFMINEDGTPNTAHTLNPVPCFYIDKNVAGKNLKNGKLADIAPTILSIMGLPIPNAMDGNILC